MTAFDLIHSAARAINACASGEVLSGAEIQDALVVLNHFIDVLNSEKLAIYTLNRQVFALTANKQTYTMGAGGDFNVARPARIEYGSIISNANPVFPVELPKRHLLTDKDWQLIRVKNTTSALPNKIYDDGSFPSRNISVWPVPSDSTPQIALYTWNALAAFVLDGTDYTFPPGYLEGIKYNFARRLSAEWPGTIFTPEAQSLAREGMARIKNSNVQISKMECDVTTSGDGHYDWRTDEIG